MDESSNYPSIDPTNYDLIIVGTGVPESIIAAAASSAGKSVLHLDPNAFYGSHFSSPSLQETVSFLQFHPTTAAASTATNSFDAPVDSEYTAIDLAIRPLISDPEVSAITPELEGCGRFSLDVSGPRVLFCADSTVDFMIKSGISEYLDFKSVDASFVYDGNGGLSRVPGSRAEIFKDRSLALTEKTQLMRFFKLALEHMESNGHEASNGNSNVISPEDMERPFTEFLTKMRLPLKIKSVILYALAMADNDQETDASMSLLKTNEAMSRLALYLSSIGRFPNAVSGMLYPMYGHGEVPQSFCRRAAVKGCIYVLRMPVVAILVDKDSKLYKGIKLGSGQELFSHQLVLDPCYVIPPSLHISPPQRPGEHMEDHSLREGKVARGICITRKSIKSEASNLLIVYPPRSLYPEQVSSVRALQIGSNVAVCPSEMFVLYLSTPCDNASEGKKSIKAAIDALFAIPDLKTPVSVTIEDPEISSTLKSEDAVDYKPTLLWSAIFIQEVLKGLCHSNIVSAPSPDVNLSYNDLVDASLKLFHEMYPDAELFPETNQANNSEDNDDEEMTITHITTTSDNSKEEDRPTDELSAESS